MNYRVKAINLGFLVLAAATACGPSNKDAQPIDTVTVRQALVENSSDLAATLSANLQFLEHSSLLANAVGAAIAEEPTPVPCADFDTCDDGVLYEEEPFELDTDIEEEVDELVEELQARVFNDKSVETQTETSVTYLIQGSLLCEDDDGDDNCAAQVDAAQLRLHVTSPSTGNLDIDLLVGPERANPATVRVHHRLLGLSVDLGEVKTAANHIGSVIGSEVNLPSTFEGAISAELSATDTTVTGAAHIDRAVKVTDGDFSVAIAAATDLFRVVADAQAQSLELGANVPQVAAEFTVEDDYVEDYDPGDDEPVGDWVPAPAYRAGIFLAGATGNVTLAADVDVITATGLGLGGETSTFSVDGKQVLAIDLNANAGRALDVTVSADDEATVVEVSPELDLRAALNFADAGDAFSTTEPWLLDDVLTVQLAGAETPTLRITDQLQVITGTLTLALQNAGTTLTADAGQCILDIDVEDTDEPAAPFDGIEVGACH